MKRRLRVWIDIENLPQVQYLLPFEDAFRRAGADVVFTARDDGFTIEHMHRQGVSFSSVGSISSRSKWHKVKGVWQRSTGLVQLHKGRLKPDLLLSPSRAAVLAARRMGIPSFALSDYEHGNLSVYRFARTTIFYPDVLDPEVLVRRGIDPARLVPYAGLKEDVAFAAVDLEAVKPHRFPSVPAGMAKVLFRPPAEQSHYFKRESRAFALAVLRELAGRDDVVVIYSPRVLQQVEYLDLFRWRRNPIVLSHPVGFVSLLKAVDAVVSGGGTMVREAAYLGVPAYSIFQGKTAAVDHYLQSIGRLKFVESPDEFGHIAFQPGVRRPVLKSNPHLVYDVTEAILSRIAGRD